VVVVVVPLLLAPLLGPLVVLSLLVDPLSVFLLLRP